MNKIYSILAIFCAALFCSCAQDAPKAETNAVLDFLNHRFGMFIHYNMGTMHGEQWAKPGHDPKSFNPQKVDCEQWAKAAASAKMSYAVFTTKHHDGFCLWNSSVTDYDIASSSYKGDLVKEYVDAFRKEGLDVGLYFSVWDRQHNIELGNIDSTKIEYLKTQLTELMTNYGDILCVVIDGWGSVWGKSPTFEEIPFAVLADHIHSMQPNCLVINHSCCTDSAYTQIVHYEATHGQHCPNDNTIPSQQGPTIQPKWFWEEGYQDLELKSVSEILSELDFCSTHWANYLLNAAPNRDGYMDENVVKRLAEVGAAWVKPAPLTELPTITKSNAGVKTEATSFQEGMLPENVLDADLYSVWQPKADDKTPSIVLDYGKDMTFNKIICGEHQYNVKSFMVEVYKDGEWVKLAVGGEMTFHFVATFPDVTAQKFRLTILEYANPPKIREITLLHYNQF